MTSNPWRVAQIISTHTHDGLDVIRCSVSLHLKVINKVTADKRVNKCVCTCGCEQLLCASVRLSRLFTARLFLDVCVNMLLFLPRVIWFLVCQSLASFTCPHFNTLWSLNDTQTCLLTLMMSHTPAFTDLDMELVSLNLCVRLKCLTCWPSFLLFITRWIRHMILWCSCRAWLQIGASRHMARFWVIKACSLAVIFGGRNSNFSFWILFSNLNFWVKVLYMLSFYTVYYIILYNCDIYLKSIKYRLFNGRFTYNVTTCPSMIKWSNKNDKEKEVTQYNIK